MTQLPQQTSEIDDTTIELVIAAPIWARSSDEQDLLSRSVAVLAGTGLPIILADGGSNDSFLATLSTFPTVTIIPYNPGSLSRMDWQIRTALSAARRLNPDFILYTEPDKEWFFQNKLGDFLKNQVSSHKIGIVVASRSQPSLETYPTYQQRTESILNDLCATTIGQTGDFVYGPMLIRPHLVPYLENCTASLGWGWRLFMLVASHRLGLEIQASVYELPCPEHDRNENTLRDQIYRLSQLEQNVRGISLALQLQLLSQSEN